MKNIEIKRHNIILTYNHPTQLVNTKNIISAAQVDQLLSNPTFNEMIEPIKGCYTWTLEGCTHTGYAIVATANGGEWIETNIHKTPKKALTQFFRSIPSWAEMIKN